MDDHIDDIVKEILKMVCIICHKYVTVSPIHVSENGTQYRCGRCKAIECEVKNRCLLLENIAKFLTVPCIYSKCEDRIPWREVEKHEKICAYRTMLCPVYYDVKCGKKIKIEQLVDHMTDFHGANICEGKFIHELDIDCHSVHVLLVRGIPFLVFISFQTVCVTSMKPSTSSTYNLKLSNIESFTSILYENQGINEEYDEKINCCKCLSGECEEKSHPHSSFYGGRSVKLRTTSINIKQIENNFGRVSSLIFTIEILPKKKTGSAGSKNVSVSTDLSIPLGILDVSNSNDNGLRKNFRCSNCLQYMTGPIYNCQTGHPVCDDCELKFDSCPICRSKIGSSRNLPFENLAKILTISCSKRQDHGCTFKGTLSELTTHEEICFKTE